MFYVDVAGGWWLMKVTEEGLSACLSTLSAGCNFASLRNTSSSVVIDTLERIY
jgi:hypothetical protein